MAPISMPALIAVLCDHGLLGEHPRGALPNDQSQVVLHD